MENCKEWWKIYNISPKKKKNSNKALFFFFFERKLNEEKIKYSAKEVLSFCGSYPKRKLRRYISYGHSIKWQNQIFTN